MAVLLTDLLSLGCAEKNEPDFERIRGAYGPVPSAAKMVAEGKGEMSYKAPASGVMYVYDLDAHRVVYTRQLQKNQLLTIDFMHNRMTLDGLAVRAPQMRKDHTHRLYFDPDPVEKSRKQKQSKA